MRAKAWLSWYILRFFLLCRTIFMSNFMLKDLKKVIKYKYMAMRVKENAKENQHIKQGYCSSISYKTKNYSALRSSIALGPLFYFP